MVDSLKTQLVKEFSEARNSGLKIAVDALQGGSSAVAEKQILDWLVAWINKGPVDQRQEVVANYLQNGFKALIGMNDQSPMVISSLSTGLGTRMETLENNLKLLSHSVGPLFAGRTPVELLSFSAAMDQVTPTRTVKPGKEAAANGEQSLKLSQLLNVAFKESGISFSVSDTQEQRQENAKKLNAVLVKTLEENKALFTKSFFADTKTKLAELIDDTFNFIEPLASNPDVLKAMLDTNEEGGRFWNETIAGKSITHLSSEELSALIPQDEYRALVESVQAKLGPILQSGDQQSLDFIGEQIARMSPQEKMVALIKARETGDVVAVRKQTGKMSLGDFISEKNIMQLLSTAAIGLIAGGIFGVPGLGVLAMGLISLLGLTEDKAPSETVVNPPTPQKQQHKVPVLQ